ncbi:MAG: hypothetical protein ACRENN_03375 [Candidatus Eiseniibacteriota bacterium]
MTAYVPPFAPIIMLAFLGTAFLLVVVAATLVYAVLTKKRGLAARTLSLAGGIIVAYATLLLAASFTSRTIVLQHGELKYFCEIDCHLAYSVEKVEMTPQIGNVHATGTFFVVALKTWFDPSTISPRRPLDVPLKPGPRTITMQDSRGRRYAPSAPALDALIAMGRSTTPIAQPLKPGESYISYFVFDIPKEARNPRLFVGNGVDVEPLLIGHELSPWHQRVWFSIF